MLPHPVFKDVAEQEASKYRMDKFVYCPNEDCKYKAVVVHESKLYNYQRKIYEDDYQKYMLSFMEASYFESIHSDDLVASINSLIRVILLESKFGGSFESFWNKFIRMGFSESMCSELWEYTPRSDIKILVYELDRYFRIMPGFIRSINIPAILNSSVLVDEWKFLIEGFNDLYL
jgi:hypothetical protein